MSRIDPPQFGLKAMFWFVSLLCAFFGVVKVLSLAWAIGLVLLVLLIAAHVVGNALGTRLRDSRRQSSASTEGQRGDEYDPDASGMAAVPRSFAAPSPAPANSRLQQNRPIGWRTIGLITCGAVLGGALGGVLLASIYWDHLDPLALSIGILASAIIGAIFTFATSCFWETIHEAWREAVK